MRRFETQRASYCLVGVVAVAVYLNSLGGQFVFDDILAVRDNPIVTQPRWMLHAFTTDYWRGASSDLLYRPLTVLSFAFNHLLHGPRPFGFHLVNVALHALVCLLVVRLTGRLFDQPRPALITGLWFAVHPIHTEAVASIVGRAELLMTLFTLLAIQYYWDARESPLPMARHKFRACMICFLFACFSKENGIMALALILLTDLTVCLRQRNWSRFRGQEAARAVLCYLSLAAVAALYLLVRYLVLGNLTLAQVAEGRFTFRGLLIGFPWYLQFANALQYFARYLGLLTFPLHLSSDWSFNQLPPHASVWHWDIGLGAFALVGLVAVAVLAVRQALPLAFGIAWFLISFLPVSNFFIPIMTILAERVMYLPSFGFLLAVSWAFDVLLGRSTSPCPNVQKSRSTWTTKFVFSVLLILLTLGAARTVVRNRDWRGELALFSSATRVSPCCANAWNCLGDALTEAGRYPEALDAYNRSLEIIPDHGVFHFRKANSLLRWGRTQEAMESYRLAVQHEPNLSDACDALGRLHLAQGDLEQARHWALRAVLIQPTRASFHYNLGYILQMRGELREARERYREAWRLNPAEPSYAFNLALLERDSGNVDAALLLLQKAVELAPQNEKYWMTLADTLLKKGAIGPARLALEQFIQISTNAALVARAREILDRLPR